MPGIEYNEFGDPVDCGHEWQGKDADYYVISSIEDTIKECLAPVIDFMGWVANLDAVDMHNISTDEIMRRAKRVELSYRGRDTTNGTDPRTTITPVASEVGQLHGLGDPDHE